MLLGLCSKLIETWRIKARAFLCSDEVLQITSYDNINIENEKENEDGRKNHMKFENHESYVSLIDIRKAEVIVLEKCLNLYLEPRLLRIKPQKYWN